MREIPIPTLPMAAIYDHPDDFPDHIVVRIFEVRAGTAKAGGVMLANTIEGARRMVPVRFDYCIPRDVDDDPKIIETWI